MSAATPPPFCLTASFSPPLHLACAAATPGRFLSPAPTTKFSIGSHRDSLERPSLQTKRAFLLLTSLLPYFLIFLPPYFLFSSSSFRHTSPAPAAPAPAPTFAQTDRYPPAPPRSPPAARPPRKAARRIPPAYGMSASTRYTFC